MGKFENGSYNMSDANICESCGSLKMVADHEVDHGTKGLAYVVFGWLFFAISLLFMPILFGGAAFLMGFFVYHLRSQMHGIVLMMFAAIGLILGSLFSLIVAGTMII
jgi:hypothetical protein